jgi:hypothetical protein
MATRNASVKYYDGFTKQWVLVPADELASLKQISATGQTAIQTWCLTAMPDIISTRALLALEASTKVSANATTYKLLLDARLALYDAFRASLIGAPSTQVMAAFLQVADAGIQAFVNERDRLKYSINVAKQLQQKQALAYIGADDAITSLRSFAAVFATTAV